MSRAPKDTRRWRGAQFVHCDTDNLVTLGELCATDGLITSLTKPTDAPAFDLTGKVVVPGFVQTHIHLVQTLFRGLADDLALMDWLRNRIWPLEASHDEESVYWSARLGLTELLLGGTTAILDMATVQHTDAVFRAAEECGIRLHCGSAMMDRENEAGLWQSTDRCLADACALADKWHGRGKLKYAFAPRFVPSCTEELLTQTRDMARARGCLIHTHSSENVDELALVRELTGRENVEYLHDIGLTGPDVVLAHCVHLSSKEMALLASTGTRVVHCPSSNLKLSSGYAPIPEMVDQGVHVSLGADGAPCNNRLDIFQEMRLAALIHKPRAGATALPARQVLRFATKHGAEALGHARGGQLAETYDADFVVLDPDTPATTGGTEPHGMVVYAMSPANVREVWIGGERVVADGHVVAWDTQETITEARKALDRVIRRAGL